MSSFGKHGEALAVALAAGSTVVAAAAKVGISNSHAYRLSKSSAVQARVSEIRAASTSAAVGMLCDASRQAVAVLVAIMANTESKDGDRIRAASVVLATVGPMSELGELRQRLDAIEAQRQGLGVVG